MDCMYEWFYKKIGGRVFIDLDPIANAYYELASPWTPTGDFEIEVDFSTTTTTGTRTFVAGATASNNSIVCDIQASGSVRFFAFVGGTIQSVISSTTLGLNDGKLHNVKFNYTGTTAAITVDGVADNTSTWALNGAQNVGLFGKRASDINFFDGIIANAKLTDKSGASDVVTTFRLDNSAAANNYIYGSELLDNNTFPDNANARQYLVSSKGWIITDGGAA